MQDAQSRPRNIPDFSRQIDILRKLEPPNGFPFLLQVFLVIGGSFAAYLLAGWWVCAVWSVVYIASQLCEKFIVRAVPDNPSVGLYRLVLAVLTVEATVYCFMPIYFWFLGPDIAKYGSLALITSSTMHTMLHRAAYPSILLCFLIPDAAVFAVISVSAYATGGASFEAALYLIGGVAICAFFVMMFFQVYQKEARALREVAERQVAEEAQKASEIRFRSLFESAPIPIREEDLSGIKRMIDALGISDPEAFSTYLENHPEFLTACSRQIVVVDANRASLEQHGYADKSEMLAKVVGTLSPSAMKIVRMTAQALHAGESGKSYETSITRADGEQRIVAATWSVIPGHERTYSRILLCSLDVTEHRKSEEALRQAQKMEAVGQLTGGVAHDFNNLLTVIGGNLDLMEGEETIKPELATPIRKAVDRGSELTQRLLAFSRNQPLAPQSVNLANLIQETSALIDRTLGDDICVSIDLEEDLWPAIADPGQVEAALLNLALNARDAMPVGGMLRISCSNAPVGADAPLDLLSGDYIKLAISDTGTGMTPDVMGRVYEPFFTTKEVGKGSGLGLPSVYGFTKQSGGDVHIQSEPGNGTTVSMYLPRSMEADATHSRSNGSASKYDGDGVTVLILEDDDDVRRYLVRLMAMNGFNVLEAAQAQAARAVVQSGSKIDLLISDVMLPGGMLGPEFAAEVLKDIPDLGVILISGRPSEADLNVLPTPHSATVLQKPFAREQLLQTVRKTLQSEAI